MIKMRSYFYERAGDKFNPAINTSLWEKVGLWFSTGLAKTRHWLKKRGVPLAASFDDHAAVYEQVEAPGKEWVLHKTNVAAEQVEQILAWIDEAVLRAPVIAGLDKQLLGVGIYRLNRQQVAWESVVMDKYGWRKKGRADIEEWLRARLSECQETELAITAQTICLANMMRAVKK